MRLQLAVLGLAVASAGGALLVGPVAGMGLDVLAEVIGAHESLVADGAREPLLPRVGPQVPLQFVGPRETFAAKQPVAHEGPLARVPPEVRLQVGRFTVDFAAARDVAAVDVLLAEVGPCRP